MKREQGNDRMTPAINMQRLRDAVEDMLRETLARGDTVAPGWRDEIFAIARMMVLEERWACAKIAEEMVADLRADSRDVHISSHTTANKIKDAIHKRTQIT